MLIDQALQMERLHQIIRILNDQLKVKDKDKQPLLEQIAGLEQQIAVLENQVSELEKQVGSLKKKTERDAAKFRAITEHLDSLRVPKGPMITRIRKLRKTPVQ